MKLTYLVSCMHQHDASIIYRMGIQSDVVVVNQCNIDSFEEFDFFNNKGEKCHAKFICTTERGLSKSRNMAIRFADNEICQLCDDDELVIENAEDIIIKMYEHYSDIGVIAFSLDRKDINKKYPKKEQILGFKQILQTGSPQITFRRSVIRDKQIYFDEKMGSGTGNGAGEENKFLFDCKKNNIKLFYIPENIATILPNDSQWFKGYTSEYMKNKGWSTRRILGFIWGFLYVVKFGLSKFNLYKNEMSIFSALKFLLIGFFEKR